jgi:hypothetical protein
VGCRLLLLPAPGKGTSDFILLVSDLWYPMNLEKTMHFFMKIGLGLILFCIISFSMLSVMPARAQDLSVLTGVREGFTPQRVRLVIDSESLPQYQIYALHKPERIVLDLFESACDDGILSDIQSKDTLVKRIELKRVHFRQISLVVSLNYEIPEEAIHVSTIAGHSSRLVVDLEKCSLHPT